MGKPLSRPVRRTGVRIAWVVMLLAAACGGQQAATLDASTPTTPATVTSARPTSPFPSPSLGATTPPASAGSGQATVSATTTPGSPPPSPAAATIHPTAGSAFARDADSGTTVHLRVGQRLQVQLTQDAYDPPVSSSTLLVRRSSSGGYPTGRPVNAVFEAVSRGTADVTATSDAACFHTQPRCMMPTRMWSVHVTVT